MATKWTSARVEQLFLLIVVKVVIRPKEVAEKWKAAYPDEEFQPTGRAIQEKMSGLRKQLKKSGPNKSNSKDATSVPGNATKWTAARVEKLFLLIIDDVKVDCSETAKIWKAAYPDESYQPTARAIQEKIAGLKKQTESSPTKAEVSSVITPSKTKQAHVVPTITDPQRKRGWNAINTAENEDDLVDNGSDHDGDEVIIPNTKRAHLSSSLLSAQEDDQVEGAQSTAEANMARSSAQRNAVYEMKHCLKRYRFDTTPDTNEEIEYDSEEVMFSEEDSEDIDIEGASRVSKFTWP